MDYHFKGCIERKKLIKCKVEKDLIRKEFNAAESDLKDAEDVFKISKYKMTTITAYYAMFHAARSLLYSKGYKEKSHFCLRSAIKTLFVDKNLLEPSLLDDYDTAKDLRENADYKSDFSKESAEALIIKAKNFLKQSKKLLN